ncbi:MAG TPA: hypothetical protein PKD53_11385 [Chloroflexaceae bacterium]|nr:hypothetical protein [Chloroflexaceae bacterium]
MTERQHEELIEILRRRLGSRHMAGIDEGRADIVGVLRDELSIERDEADALLGRLMDAGLVRYVTSDERDPVGNPEVIHDPERPERTDPAERPIAVPPVGGPQEGYSGLSTGSSARAAGAAIPVAGAGTGSPAAGPVAVVAADPTTAGEAAAQGTGPGYWDIGGSGAGIVPSSTRKGQVEPRGT